MLAVRLSPNAGLGVINTNDVAGTRRCVRRRPGYGHSHLRAIQRQYPGFGGCGYSQSNVCAGIARKHTCVAGEEWSVTWSVCAAQQRRRNSRSKIHSQTSTARCFWFQIPHWLYAVQWTLSSQILVAVAITVPGILCWGLRLPTTGVYIHENADPIPDLARFVR